MKGKRYTSAQFAIPVILKSTLKKHVESIHENKESYECPNCDYSFSLKGNLKRHIKSVHENRKPNKCSICEYSCYESRNLKVHIESVHKGKNYINAQFVITVVIEKVF